MRLRCLTNRITRVQPNALIRLRRSVCLQFIYSMARDNGAPSNAYVQRAPSSESKSQRSSAKTIWERIFAGGMNLNCTKYDPTSRDGNARRRTKVERTCFRKQMTKFRKCQTNSNSPCCTQHTCVGRWVYPWPLGIGYVVCGNWNTQNVLNNLLDAHECSVRGYVQTLNTPSTLSTDSANIPLRPLAVTTQISFQEWFGDAVIVRATQTSCREFERPTVSELWLHL